tara:strand:+ start:1252 stop:1392 length:141 start_codon:yes stop_codon:yes gene_type:complete
MSDNNTARDVAKGDVAKDEDGFADAMATVAIMAIVVITAVLWVSSQ